MKLYLGDSNARFDSALVQAEARRMKIYLADGSFNNPSLAAKGIETAPRLRILLSYYYFKSTNLDEAFAKYFLQPYPEVFLDSGAYTAFSQGVAIDIQEYCAYVHRFKHLFSTYANLDVIGSPGGTFENQKIMESEGLSPLPVFHVEDAWKYLKIYLERYTYMALGGMVPYMSHHKRELMPWLIRCFKMAKKETVFHGFGCTAWEVICALPWYSVDSSSWGQGFRYGQVPLFDERSGKFFKVDLGNHKQCYEYAALFQSLGFSAGDFAHRSKNDRVKICAISALSYIKAEQWLEKRHGQVEIPQEKVESV